MFQKTIGNGVLTFEELEDVALSNCPLSYLKDDVELPVLMPSSMLNINPGQVPELKAHHLENQDLRKRAKFLRKCKQAMWNRSLREYVRSLCGLQSLPLVNVQKYNEHNENICMRSYRLLYYFSFVK